MILSIGHSKGGVGKSTLTWHMIFVLIYLTSKKVRVLDLDFQQTIYFLNIIRQKCGYDAIDVIQPKDGSELLAILDDGFDGYTIIDLGGFDNDINRLALQRSDKILIPIKNKITELIGFQTFKEILGSLETRDVSIVLNNIHPRTKNFSKVVNAFKGRDIALLKTIIRSKVDMSDPLEKGKSVMDLNHSPSKEQMISLVKEIFNLGDTSC
jgi:chromosome partitioning protein